MAFQNEEDYLDSLLRAISNDGSNAPVKEMQEETEEQIFTPETENEIYIDEPAAQDAAETVIEITNPDGQDAAETVIETTKPDGQDAETELHEDEITPDITGGDFNEWKDSVTIGDILQSEADAAVEYDYALNQESISGNDDSDVDTYIKNLLDKEETQSEAMEEAQSEAMEEAQAEIMEEAQSEAMEEAQPEAMEEAQPEAMEEAQPQTEYIDITETESDDYNDLLGAIDGIFDDVAKETELEDQLAQQNAMEFSDTLPVNEEQSEISFSDINVDDELKELLGDGDGQLDMSETADEGGLSEEELERLAQIEAESSENQNEQNYSTEIPDEAGEDEDFGLSNLMDEVAAAGIDVNDAGLSTENDDTDNNGELEDVSAINDVSDNPFITQQDDDSYSDDNDSHVKKGQKGSKQGFLAKLLSIFKKGKKTDEAQTEDGENENQQVLDELFDENGELKGKDKKAKKKGLFSKKAKVDGAVETPLEDIDDYDAEEEREEKEKKKKEKKEKKPKKEKKKKEKKPKKEKKKKEKKPRVKKEKPPVKPGEIIHVTPVGIIIIIVIVALISGGFYMLISNFTYEQAYDTATIYMLDKKYSDAYDEIAGVTPKAEEDVQFYNQVQVIMYLQKEYNSYYNYFSMGLHYEAIDSLIKGLLAYDEYYQKAADLGVTVDFDNVKTSIVSALEESYGITESMARSYAEITDYEQYVYILESYGGKYQ